MHAIQWNYKKLATLNNVASYTFKMAKEKSIQSVLNIHFINNIGKALLDVENISQASIYSFNYTYITLKHYYKWLVKNPNKHHELDGYKHEAIERLDTIKPTEPIYEQTKLKI